MRKLRTIILGILLVALPQTLPQMRADTVQLARAIAKAEGFYVVNSRAARFHNPGNLRQNGRYRRFRTNRDGWSALLSQLNRVKNGESRVYRVDMTLAQFGRIYADGSRVWSKNVAAILGVTPSSFLADLLDVPLQPALDLKEEIPMKILTRLDFKEPFVMPLLDMNCGDIGVFLGGDFGGEVVLRNSFGFFTIEHGRVWLFKDGYPAPKQLVRLLQPGESITIKRA